MPVGPVGATTAYRDFQRKARTNFCATVVDAVVHRLLVIGVTDHNGASDDAAWSWWQANRLDARQRLVYRTALSLSEAYVSVGPHPRDPDRPLITAERPSQVITADDPATGERVAALKIWYDPAPQLTRATVFTAEAITRYTSAQRTPGADIAAWRRTEQRDNAFGVVPVVPFPCRPELGADPEPEFAGVLDTQAGSTCRC